MSKNEDNAVKKSKELLEKVSQLKDLRHAIKEVKKAGLHKVQPDAPVAPDAQMHPIKHMGIKKNKDGNYEHSLGREKSEQKYIVLSDMKKLSEKKPCYSISVLDKDEEKGRSPEFYNNLKDVVSAILRFEKNKKWE